MCCKMKMDNANGEEVMRLLQYPSSSLPLPIPSFPSLPSQDPEQPKIDRGLKNDLTNVAGVK